MSAQFNIAACYYMCRGVKKDYEKAVHWYTLAAEQGESWSQNDLGICYLKGQGVGQDYEKALEWLTKSAEQGYETAKFNLEALSEKQKEDSPF